MKKIIPLRLWALAVTCTALVSLGSVAVSGDEHSVADVQNTIGKDARHRLLPFFDQAKVQYPPRQIALLAIAEAASLELWAGPDTAPRFIRHFDIDVQTSVDKPVTTPADVRAVGGIYEVKRLHPTRDSGLAIELVYTGEPEHIAPVSLFIHNTDDSQDPATEDLGVAAEVIEELFVLLADVGKRSAKIVIAPHDPRQRPFSAPATPAWVAEHYRTIDREFARFARPSN